MSGEEVKTGEEMEETEELNLEEGEETEEKPFWLQEEEEPDSSEGGEQEDEGEEEPGSSVPVAKHAFVKKKLKAQLNEKDDELAQLRKKVEQLEQGVGQKVSTDLQPPKRPRRADFEDDDAFEDAMDKYEEDKVTYQTQFVQKSTQQNQQATQRVQQIEKAVDDHYTRAESLVEKHGIKPEIYQQADATVKGIIQQALPKLDPEGVFNGMVEIIGEGSEITMFHIGRNKAAAAEFQRLLQEDTSGLKATMYLGRISERVSGTKPNHSSQAPPPAAKLKGDEASSAKGQAAQKKYDAAVKKGSHQEAYNIKKAARREGIDTSNWK